MKKLYAFILCFFHLALQPVVGQTFQMDGTDITTCSGFFTDSGGDTGNYLNNEDFTTTICSDGSAGTHIRLQFFQVDIDPLDLLCFYDGPSTAAPSLDCHTKFTDAFIIQATAANPSGCITVTFNSNNMGNDAGWYAAISCVPSCQLINTALQVLDPAVAIQDTGFNYIDVCPGQPINLQASGLYPQNNLVYEQQDSTSVFFWDFGNGDFADGTEVTYAYSEPGGYELYVRITDELGCESTNYLNTFVRVAAPPDFSPAGDLPLEICAGDSVGLRASVGLRDSTAELSATLPRVPFLPGNVRADSLALPDGNGVAYETSLLFTEYQPGATLQNVLDLLSICINMEHSWMRDLLITLTCPNGTTVTLHDHPGPLGSEVFLGEPFEADEGMDPVPGLGYDYCWTPTATTGTWLEYVTATGTDELPPGDYNSFDSLDSLIGCPLNGEWTITVEDLWGFDNGYVFFWGINFNPDLLVNRDSFDVPVSDFQWIPNPATYFSSPDSIAFSPPNGGLIQVPFQITDSFGCVFDTLVSVRVRSPLDTACYECTDNAPLLDDLSICEGDTAVLDASGLLSLDQPQVTFEHLTSQPVPAVHRDSTNPFVSELPVSNVFPLNLDDPLNQICGLCLELQVADPAGIQLRLQAPGGELLSLSEFRGGGGSDFIQTCFEPGATQPIASGAPPFTGAFQPDGDWAALTGAAVNGTWRLLIVDSSGQSPPPRLISWSLCLQAQNQVTYQWSVAGSLSCTDCAAPQAFPLSGTSYIVEAEDAYGCISRDTVEVTVNNTQVPFTPDCSVPDEGELLFSWLPMAEVSAYQVSVNAGNWQASNGALSHLVTGLQDGDTVFLQLTGVPLPDACPSDTVETFCVYEDPCQLQIGLLDVQLTACFDSNDGSVLLSSQGAEGPPEFSLNAQAYQPNPLFTNLPPGDYLAVVRDSAGCTDSLDFSIGSPDTLLLSLLVNDVSCAGGSNGLLSAQVENNQGPLSYQWSGPNGFTSDLPAPDQLAAGVYCLEITDANGCRQSACDTIAQPPPLDLTVVDILQPSCFDSEDGSLTVSINGGTPGYEVVWSDPQGQSTLQATELSGGDYNLTVTDNNGCTEVFSLNLPAPSAVQVDGFLETSVSCKGLADGALQVQVSGGTQPYSFLWSDPAAQQVNPAGMLAEGIYTVTITDAQGCTQSGSAEVTAPDSIVILADVTDAPCFGEAGGSISALPQGGTAPYTYQWSGGLPDASVVDNLPAGAYNLQVVDAAGCLGSNSFTVGEPAPLQLEFALSPASCFNRLDGGLSAQAQGGTPPYAFNWSNGASGEDLSNLAPGPYELTLTDGQGCTLIEQAEVGAPPPVGGEVETMPTRCSDTRDGMIFAMGLGGSPPFSYSLEGGPFSPNSTFSGLKSGVYLLVIRDANGCEFSITSEVVSPPPIIVDAGPDLTLELGDSVQLNFSASNAQGLIRPTWRAEYGGTLLCDTCLYCEQLEVACPAPWAQPEYNISYTIVVEDEAGCRAEDQLRVSVTKDRRIFVPTGFTPNGDNQNDRLRVHGVENARVVRYQVYDRWGELLYETGAFEVNDPLMGWDGTFRGEEMPSGTYVWFVEVEFPDGVRIPYNGHSTLIR